MNQHHSGHVPDSGSTSLTAEEAAKALGVSRSTLYAYVSRGLVRSEPVPGSRRRRYARDDVERLLRQQEARRDPDRAAEQSLEWGGPVIESSLTRIADGRLYYRGQDALELARERTLEEVAALLWTGNMEMAVELFPPRRPEANDHEGPATPPRGGTGRSAAAGAAAESESGDEMVASQKSEEEGGSAVAGRRGADAGTSAAPTTLERCQAALALAGAADPAAWDLRPSTVARTGARILSALVETVGDGGPADAPGALAGRLARRWGIAFLGDAGALDPRLLDAALVLCADHELNVSTFTARCVASAAATPWDAAVAGLSALKGTRHGGGTGRVEALLREATSAADAPQALAARLRRGDPIPGFGHRLYPAGDPRADLLLELAYATAPGAEAALLRTVVESAGDLLGERPNLDFGLVALCRALGLPSGTALLLFAVGRTVGWIAHAIEEYQRGRLIRPRARYVGA